MVEGEDFELELDEGSLDAVISNHNVAVGD